MSSPRPAASPTGGRTPSAEVTSSSHPGGSGTGLIVGGVLVLVAGALAPVLAEVPALTGASTLLWLASMPLCLLGAGLTAAGVLRRRAARAARRDDWG